MTPNPDIWRLQLYSHTDTLIEQEEFSDGFEAAGRFIAWKLPRGARLSLQYRAAGDPQFRLQSTRNCLLTTLKDLRKDNGRRRPQVQLTLSVQDLDSLIEALENV